VSPASTAASPTSRALHHTGPITRIAKIFGAGILATGLVALAATSGAAAGPDAVPHSLFGRVRSALAVPAPVRAHVAFTSAPDATGAWFLEVDGRVRRTGAAIGHRDAPTDPATDPAVDIAAASDSGYWVLTVSGRVMPRGSAPRLRDLDLPLAARHAVAIAAHPSGRGYWIATSDGRISAFGLADRHGDPRRVITDSDVVDVAATPTGDGYYLVTRTGRVFAYGDALDLGDPAGFIGPDVVGIAADPDGSGYWLALDTGAVLAYRAGGHRLSFTPQAVVPTIDITARPDKGFWTLQGPRVVDHLHPFLVCTRSHESSHTPPAYDDGYDAVNPSGKYRGAYQFSRSTWDTTAEHAGRPDLIGVDPAAASVVDQDLMALHLYRWQGADPWLGRCAGL
jgi:hypothetical protein